MRRDRSDSWNYILYSDGDTPSLFMSCIMPYIDYNDEWKLKQAKDTIQPYLKKIDEARNAYVKISLLYNGSQNNAAMDDIQYLKARSSFNNAHRDVYIHGINIKISDKLTWKYVSLVPCLYEIYDAPRIIDTLEDNEWYAFLMKNMGIPALHTLLPGVDIYGGDTKHIISEYNNNKDVLEMLQRYGSKVADIIVKAYHRLFYVDTGTHRCHGMAVSTGERCRNKVKNGKYCHHHRI